MSRNDRNTGTRNRDDRTRSTSGRDTGGYGGSRRTAQTRPPREKSRGALRLEREMKRRKALHRFAAMFICLIIAAGAASYVFFFQTKDIALLNPYDKSDPVLGMKKMSSLNGTAVSFAADLSVATADIPLDGLELEAQSAALIDVNNKDFMYGKNIHEKRYPASITKIMTTLVALKYGNLDDMVTVGEEAKDIEYGSSVCEIQPGDQLSMKMLLYGLMINSGNDAAMTIAKHVGGSVEGFINMMNQEAQEIGATNTHFMNAHGLQDEDHYTTVYDVYLMFNEALKYDTFRDIISMHSYEANFTRPTDEDANAQTMITWESTNHYFINEAVAPSDVTVFGGKTGTTDEAGACLCLYSKDKYGNPYISIILKEDSKDQLYNEMNELLSKINK